MALEHSVLDRYSAGAEEIQPDLCCPVDYDASLESFSRPLLQLIDYRLDEMGQMTVENDTACWYQNMDMTVQAEALYEFVNKTIEEELVEVGRDDPNPLH